MHHADIFCALMKKRITLTEIAKVEGISVSVVSEVIRGKKKSFDVATAISAKLNISLNRLFPGQYEHTPRGQRRETHGHRQAA